MARSLQVPSQNASVSISEVPYLELKNVDASGRACPQVDRLKESQGSSSLMIKMSFVVLIERFALSHLPHFS